MQPHLKGHVPFRIHYWWWVWLACLTFRSINFLELYQGQNCDLNIMQSSRMELPLMSPGRECVWTAQRPLHIDFSTSVMHWFLSRAYSDNEALPSSRQGLPSNACLSFTVSFQYTQENPLLTLFTFQRIIFKKKCLYLQLRHVTWLKIFRFIQQNTEIQQKHKHKHIPSTKQHFYL